MSIAQIINIKDELGDLLPPGFNLQNPTLDDLKGVAGLVTATEIAESGESDGVLDDLRSSWQNTDFNLETDAWVVVAPGREAQIVGYEDVWNRSSHARLDGDGYVHPDYQGLGIGTALLRVMEARARQHIPLAPEGVRVSIRNGLYGSDQRGRQLHENEGYQPIRYFWRMQIRMQEAPPEPVWPEGITIRNAIPGQDDRTVFDAFEEAFRDHWGYTPWDFDSWRRRGMDFEAFDPSLWFLAMENGQIAGGALCKTREEGGWVGQLAVRRTWRRKGLGLALLHLAFGEFYRRGTTRVDLGVDASNLTGATRLYERAGMHIAHEFVLYEKELRPGRDLEESR